MQPRDLELHVLEALGRNLKDVVEEVDEFRTTLAQACPKYNDLLVRLETNFEAVIQEKEELRAENASLKSCLEEPTLQGDAGSVTYNTFLSRLQTDFKAVLKENEEMRAENAFLKSSREM